mmetsp:Transcript_9095/g.10108  ORF Transcript_9095/g.10108 Transcript_9095/m.10108 type:complete len:556 (+) Transcript_9095:47-1714(+)
MKGLLPCLILGLFFCQLTTGQKTVDFDIVIYAATPAGLTAAIGAAMNSPELSIAIVEPELNFGGMVVSGGIGLRDLGEPNSFGGLGLAWTMMNAKHYNVSYPVYQPDMYIGDENWKAMLGAHPSIKLVYNQPLLLTKEGVEMDGTRITSILTGDAVSTATKWQAKVFIDASYEGDVMRMAGVSYTFGREASSTYNESYGGVMKYTETGNFLKSNPVSALKDGKLVPFVNPGPLQPVGSADDKMMGYSYRLCITNNKENMMPFPKPKNYNPDDFIMLQRYLDSLVSSRKYPDGPPFNYLVDVLAYRSYPHRNKWDLCDSARSAFTSDVINLNAGYANGTREEREQIAHKHHDYLAGYLTYLSTNESVPSYTKASTNSYGLCKDEWPYNSNWPKQFYVREAARLVGERVTSQNDLVGGKCTTDSIGVGSWGLDIHVVQRVAVPGPTSGSMIADNEGQLARTIVEGKGRVYELSYSLLLPKKTEATNLLVPVCHSASHVAYSSTRVEPTFIQLGQASGVAATLAIKESVAVHDIDLPALQKILESQDMLLHYPKGSCQ